jgi:hypothetical protein
MSIPGSGSVARNADDAVASALSGNLKARFAAGWTEEEPIPDMLECQHVG